MPPCLPTRTGARWCSRRTHHLTERTRPVTNRIKTVRSSRSSDQGDAVYDDVRPSRICRRYMFTDRPEIPPAPRDGTGVPVSMPSLRGRPHPLPGSRDGIGRVPAAAARPPRAGPYRRIRPPVRPPPAPPPHMPRSPATCRATGNGHQNRLILDGPPHRGGWPVPAADRRPVAGGRLPVHQRRTNPPGGGPAARRWAEAAEGEPMAFRYHLPPLTAAGVPLSPRCGP